jgi:phosphoribosylaminoimidazole-succinocarboxamide synthase
MIDKNIIGTGLTILTILGTFIFSLGITSHKMESFEKDINTQSIKINKNHEEINNLENTQIKIETMMKERFDKIESLLMEM